MNKYVLFLLSLLIGFTSFNFIVYYIIINDESGYSQGTYIIPYIFLQVMISMVFMNNDVYIHRLSGYSYLYKIIEERKKSLLFSNRTEIEYTYHDIDTFNSHIALKANGEEFNLWVILSNVVMVSLLDICIVSRIKRFDCRKKLTIKDGDLFLTECSRKEMAKILNNKMKLTLITNSRYENQR